MVCPAPESDPRVVGAIRAVLVASISIPIIMGFQSVVECNGVAGGGAALSSEYAAAGRHCSHGRRRRPPVFAVLWRPAALPLICGPPPPLPPPPPRREVSTDWLTTKTQQPSQQKRPPKTGIIIWTGMIKQTMASAYSSIRLFTPSHFHNLPVGF